MLCGPITDGVWGRGSLTSPSLCSSGLAGAMEAGGTGSRHLSQGDLGLRASDLVLRRCFPIILKTPIHPNEILLSIMRPQWTRSEYRSVSPWLAWSPSSVIYLPHGLGRVLNPLCDPSPLLFN